MFFFEHFFCPVCTDKELESLEHEEENDREEQRSADVKVDDVLPKELHDTPRGNQLL